MRKRILACVFMVYVSICMPVYASPINKLLFSSEEEAEPFDVQDEVYYLKCT